MLDKFLTSLGLSLSCPYKGCNNCLLESYMLAGVKCIRPSMHVGSCIHLLGLPWQMWWFKTAIRYYLMVLKARYPKSRCWQNWFLWRPWRRICPMPLDLASEPELVLDTYCSTLYVPSSFLGHLLLNIKPTLIQNDFIFITLAKTLFPIRSHSKVPGGHEFGGVRGGGTIQLTIDSF